MNINILASSLGMQCTISVLQVTGEKHFFTELQKWNLAISQI